MGVVSGGIMMQGDCVFVTAGPSRQAKTVHKDKDCLHLRIKSYEVVAVNPLELRVFVRCKYCFK